jgi:glycosyltransferase involved in cell wall biosynthesis
MISVIVITKNEEQHIARCLQSVRWAKQIVVVDCGSTDQTVKIAKSFGAEVLSTDWPGFGIQKQRALQLTHQDWVLSLDADEYLEAGAEKNIIQAIQQQADAFRLPIMMVFKNQIMRHAGCETKHIRLFKRDQARFSPDKVHEKIILPANTKVEKLPIMILHESYKDWFDAIDKMNTYSSLSAAQRAKKHHIIHAFLASKWMFIRNYFFKGWMLDGQAGFALAVYQAQGSWYRYCKQIFPDQSLNK